MKTIHMKPKTDLNGMQYSTNLWWKCIEKKERKKSIQIRINDSKWHDQIKMQALAQPQNNHKIEIDLSICFNQNSVFFLDIFILINFFRVLAGLESQLISLGPS